jgi:hypothetical protein
MMAMVDAAIESASQSSSSRGFGEVLRRATGLSVAGTLDDLAVAVASNDIASAGRLLGPRDVNVVYFDEKELPESLVRRPSRCSLLDVTVGSGSVEMTKYLLEFHRAMPTRETLKQSISTGSLELFRMMRERLSERDLRERLDLMELAADFHQWEVFLWLCRDATICERELLWLFALEGKLAVALLRAQDGGFGS